jgi:hypothetical protein
MQAEHRVMVLLLVPVTQELSKTLSLVVVLVQLLMAEMQQVTHSLVLVVLVVIFQHGLDSRQQLHTRVVVVVVLVTTTVTGETQLLALLLAV